MKKELRMQFKELKSLAKKNDLKATKYSYSGGSLLLDIKQVVVYARDVKTALHTAFEWDDDKAAEQHRLDKARELIHELDFAERMAYRATRRTSIKR